MGSRVLTFSQGHKGYVVGEDALGNGRAGGDAGVVAAVRGVHLGDVQVPRYLGDKSPLVQRDEGGEFVEDPAERQLFCRDGCTTKHHPSIKTLDMQKKKKKL